ncbi:sugar ABC transporter substrate-binding protein [Enterococcus gallinarum]|uniref:sugar ABC transporter substrate-binding protein n=1 Tax=Enterococcus TaxID=1350 RepID=UPI0028925C22|nr:sugar ABC transporter substrate-binding protein [Enterococcus gallinarum]MBS5961557.1 sugar ABC transporter substrate-binding protein [Enterococcus gallinarum]MDT2724845.1 sugar ABC transporter substrate-binding protein [Enterococcus gallinarum]
MFKLSKKKIVGTLVLASVMLLGACGNNKEASKDKEVSLPSIEDRYTPDAKTPAWQLDTKKETTKLKWYVNADWWNTEYGKDMVTKKIKEDLNIDIEFITGDDTKLNTYFAGGDMPDIVTIFDSNSQVARKADSWALPLQDLAKTYDPYFNEVTREETLNWYKLSDGKSYGYPNYSNTQSDFDSGDIFARDAFVIRKDVYEAIGKPDFTTPEGFADGMSKIKEKYPDLIPFGFNDFAKDGSSNGSMDGVVQDMLGVPYTKDGKYYDRNLDEDYINWVKAFRQVHEDGNISDDTFTDDGDKFKEKLQTGKYATVMLGSFVNQGIPLQTFKASNPDAEYIAIDGIQSTVGNKPTLTQAGISGWMINYIGKDCADPAKAIQLFTYLLSDEGEMLTNFGIEGETYTVEADNKVQWTDEARKIQQDDPEKWQLEYRMGEFIQFGHDRFKAMNDASYVDAVKQMQEWGDGKLTSQFPTENIGPDAGTQEARALSAIQTNWSTTLVGMLRAKDEKELDSLLEDYKNFQKDNKIDDINKVRNEKIEENKKKLGL